MKFLAHNYQDYSINFIEDNPISALLLECGLGKTVITLSAINDLLFDSFDVHKVLVIAPLRVARDVWKSEIAKWDHLKDLKCEVVLGSEVERLKALKRKADIYIINRENVPWLVEKSGYKFDFDMLVVDELSSFKNGRSKRFRSLLKVRPYVKRIVGLTGTPASNGLMDLWAEFRVLDLGKRLGKFITNYRNTYFEPDKRNGMVIFSYKPLAFAEDLIYKKVSDITISMKASTYLKMPELISNEFKVKLDEKESKVYKELKKEFILDFAGGEVTASNAASLSNKLVQLSNGAIYTDSKDVIEVHDRKLDALEDLVEQSNGKPMLVAYWFKHDLERIKKRLDALNVKYLMLDSKENIDLWNQGKLEVGLIHPASAGHGLNLQSGGSMLVWFGLTWSLELYQQTNARLWRQGQRDSTVIIEHIVCEDTIDEQILNALTNKASTQEALIKAVKANL